MMTVSRRCNERASDQRIGTECRLNSIAPCAFHRAANRYAIREPKIQSAPLERVKYEMRDILPAHYGERFSANAQTPRAIERSRIGREG